MKQETKRKPLLTLYIDKNSHLEIYMLNPGEIFEGFGGSRHGLKVGKTASMITRMFQNGMEFDKERNIDDAWVWELIEKKIGA